MMSDVFFRLVFLRMIALIFGFQGSGTGDDFNQLASDDSLTRAVKCHRQFVNHFTFVGKMTLVNVKTRQF